MSPSFAGSARQAGPVVFRRLLGNVRPVGLAIHFKSTMAQPEIDGWADSRWLRHYVVSRDLLPPIDGAEVVDVYRQRVGKRGKFVHYRPVGESA